MHPLYTLYLIRPKLFPFDRKPCLDSVSHVFRNTTEARDHLEFNLVGRVVLKSPLLVGSIRDIFPDILSYTPPPSSGITLSLEWL